FPKALKVDKGVKLNWNVHFGVVMDSALAVFWQDNGPVTMLSIIYELVCEEWKVEREKQRPKETNANTAKVHVVFGSESRKKLKISKIIDDYNNNMNGVDIANQLQSYYSGAQLRSNSEQETRRLRIIKYFKLSDQCFVSRNHFAIWKRDKCEACRW
ncbi:9797_t:CDS:2, partial [Cetraspora pellucida]